MIERAFSLEITTTQQCNLGCTYCFEGCGDSPEENYKLNTDILSFEVIKDKIDYLLKDEEFTKTFNGGIDLYFWGGEPTLNNSLIEEVILHYKDNPKIRSYSLSSNGYDIRPIEKLIKLHKDIKVQISYDGGVPNELRRLTLTRKDTSNKVRNNILKLLDTDIAYLGLKATIVPQDFSTLVSAWEDYEDLYYKFKEKGRRIIYKPTIDYHNIHLINYLEDWKKAIREIAKKEIKFFKKNGEFLWEWMTGAKPQCSAGVNMSAIDVQGNVRFCHGAIYDGDRGDSMTTSNIFKDSNKTIATNILSQGKILLENTKEDPDMCTNCVATVCMRCPVNNISLSPKDDMYDRWNHNSHNVNICSYFKEFGKVNLAVLKILGENNGT